MSDPVVELLAWFDRHRREMPWRLQPTPYAVWVSEIMLQQTQVDTVIPYFDRFVLQFPDVRSLAAAPQQRVLKAWEGLGYYSRARNLQRAAQQIVSAHAGNLPRTAAALRMLPGIGPYTAAAIASICWEEPIPVVDGNVLRVFSRYLCLERAVSHPSVRREIVTFLTPLIERCDRPGDFNQAMMELGALVCRPRNPGCDGCPLHAACQARQHGRQAELPYKVPRRAVPHLHEVAVLLERRGRLLLRRRDDQGLLAGLWELPGGRLAESESAPAAARRTVREHTGLGVELSPELGTIDHVYSHFRTTIHLFRATTLTGRLPRHSATRLRWVGPRTIAAYPLSTAQQRALALAKGSA